MNLLLAVEHLLDRGGHVFDVVNDPRYLVAEFGAAYLGQIQAEHIARHDLGEEALRGRHGDFGARVGVDHRIGLARDRRPVGIAYRQHLRALFAGVTDGHQCVHGLAGLADSHHERRLVDDRIAIPEFGGQLDFACDTSPVFDGVFSDVPGIRGCPAGHNNDLVYFAEILIAETHLVELELPVEAIATAQRIGHGLGLLGYFLEHEPVVAALFGGIHIPVHLVGTRLRGVAVEIGDVNGIGPDRDDQVG